MNTVRKETRQLSIAFRGTEEGVFFLSWLHWLNTQLFTVGVSIFSLISMAAITFILGRFAHYRKISFSLMRSQRLKVSIKPIKVKGCALQK